LLLKCSRLALQLQQLLTMTRRLVVQTAPVLLVGQVVGVGKLQTD
jgi:hypothetical protein